jgi:hypothetical protein
MRAEFICQYISNEGNVCGRASTREEGCKIHWKRRQRNPCKYCGKPTTSIHGMCNLHVDKYHSKTYYHRKKLNALEKSALESFRLPEAETK